MFQLAGAPAPEEVRWPVGGGISLLLLLLFQSWGWSEGQAVLSEGHAKQLLYPSLPFLRCCLI